MKFSKSKQIALEVYDHKFAMPNLKLFKPSLDTIEEETPKQVITKESKHKHTAIEVCDARVSSLKI